MAAYRLEFLKGADPIPPGRARLDRRHRIVHSDIPLRFPLLFLGIGAPEVEQIVVSFDDDLLAVGAEVVGARFRAATDPPTPPAAAGVLHLHTRMRMSRHRPNCISEEYAKGSLSFDEWKESGLLRVGFGGRQEAESLWVSEGLGFALQDGALAAIWFRLPDGKRRSANA